MKSDDFVDAQELWYLVEMRCNLLTKLPSTINPLTKVQSLNLDFNFIDALPPAIGLMTSLRTLFLRTNSLTSLSNELDRLFRLRTLNLERNKLRELPFGLCAQLKELQVLDVLRNQLAELPDEPHTLIQCSTGYTGGDAPSPPCCCWCAKLPHSFQLPS
mmetsp:Transcript_16510/g.35868  ORF Transcript_16510/g.35868 Transcript_16510/m.35868 type:complete len:159 (-) Transcript_16510:1485-1961(-)